MQSLFITATGTNVGKTHTTVKLIEHFAKQGYKVGVFKPIETGVNPIALDATILLEHCQRVNENFKTFTPFDITAYTFTLPAAPFCADKQNSINIDNIIDKYHKLCKLCDILLVEGAGGLLVPITKTFTMLDLIKKLDTKALLVTPSRLGCINDTLLSIQALQTKNIQFDWCVNIHEDKNSFAQVTQPYYDAVFPSWWTVKDGLQKFVSKNR